MTDPSKTRKAEERIENLELNRETIQDLTEEQAEAEKGGMAAANAPGKMISPTFFINCI
jgi:hypothetical protein